MSRGAYLALFLVLALRQRDNNCLWHWIGAILGSLLGSLMLSNKQNTIILPLFEAMQVYTFFMASFTLSWSGLRSFYGRPTRMLPTIALTLLPGVFQPLARVSGVPESLGPVLFFLSAATASALVIFEIARAREERLWSQMVVAIAFAGYSASFMAGVVLVILSEDRGLSVQTAHLSILLDQVASILVYVGYVAMNGERANLELQRLSETDPLTGLYNRRGVEHVLRQLRRTESSGKPASVLIGDIDHFKKINDKLGHEAGDLILKAFTERLKSITRRNDCAMRWGGEEFLILLPQTYLAEARVLAERLRSLIATEPFDARDRDPSAADKEMPSEALNVTISIGLAEVAPGETFDSAVKRADEALYRAKSEGRNRVCT